MLWSGVSRISQSHHSLCGSLAAERNRKETWKIWVLQRQVPIGLPTLVLISVNSHELLEQPQELEPESSAHKLGSDVCYSNDESSCVYRKKEQMD